MAAKKSHVAEAPIGDAAKKGIEDIMNGESYVNQSYK